MKEKRGEHPFGDVGQLILFGAFVIVWVGDSFFLRLTTSLSNQVPLAVRLVILIVSLAVALYLINAGHVAANHERRPDGVVSSGAFRCVRHPLYLGSILAYFGLTVSTCSLLTLILFVAICLFYDYIASYEEKIMKDEFSEEYTEYKKRTGKWLPRLGKRGK